MAACFAIINTLFLFITIQLIMNQNYFKQIFYLNIKRKKNFFFYFLYTNLVFNKKLINLFPKKLNMFKIIKFSSSRILIFNLKSLILIWIMIKPQYRFYDISILSFNIAF